MNSYIYHFTNGYPTAELKGWGGLVTLDLNRLVEVGANFALSDEIFFSTFPGRVIAKFVPCPSNMARTGVSKLVFWRHLISI